MLVSPFFYFYKGGLLGTYIYLYIPIVIYILLSGKGGIQKFLFLLACLTLLLAVLTEYYYPEIVMPGRHKKFQFLDILIHVFFDILLIASVIYFLKKRYTQEKKRARYIIGQYKRNKGLQGNRESKDINLLSIREREVYQLIVKGNSNKEIANALYVSTGTIKNHITSIYKKLKVNSRIEFLNKIDS
jgi:DNA-binding CsgD family transcriptional regulator